MSRRALLISLLALVLARAVLVVSVADVFGYGEEFAKGAVAKAMLDPLGVEHHRLSYGYGEGGGFAVAHVKALLFLAFGPSVLTQKIAAIACACLVLAAGFTLLAEHVSRRAALVFAALFVLAPTNYQRFSLLGLGTHFEALGFLALVMHFTLRVTRDERPRIRDAACLGLAGGFGLFFSFLLVPLLAWTVVFALVRWRGRPPPRVIAAGLAGFFAGALPLWLMLAEVGLHEMLLRRSTSDGPKASFAASVAGLLQPLWAAGPLAWIQAAAATVVIVAGVALRRSRFDALVIGFVVAYFLSYTTSGLALSYDSRLPGSWFFLLRLAPFLFFLTLLAARGIAELWERGGRRKSLGCATLALLLAGGAYDTIGLLRGGRPSTPLENVATLARAKGYDCVGYFNYLFFHLEGTDAEKAAILLRFDDDPESLVPAVAQSVYEASGRSIESVLPELDTVFGARRELALLGLGRVLHGGWDYDVEAALLKLDSLPEWSRAGLAEALGRAGFGPRFRADRLDELLAYDPPARWREPWLRGVGWRVHATLRLRPDLAAARLQAEPAERAAPLRDGYEAARRADRLGEGRP